MWNIDDTRTWRDPDAATREPPLGENDNLYLQVRAPVRGPGRQCGAACVGEERVLEPPRGVWVWHLPLGQGTGAALPQALAA